MKQNILYWVITGLFTAFMIFSSIGGLKPEPATVAYLHDHLGYPIYFIQWISVFKIIGAIAILLPMVPARVKEWAYFGFFIDLVTGAFSFYAVGDPVSQWAPMILFIGVLVWAYMLHHRRLRSEPILRYPPKFGGYFDRNVHQYFGSTSSKHHHQARPG